MVASWTHESHMQNRSFRIVDLLEQATDLLSERTFEDCTIYGPAVLVPLSHTTFEGNVFEGDPTALFWEIPEERERVTGGVGVLGCTFRRCIFRMIGIAGTTELISMFLEAPTSDQAAGVLT